MRFHSTVYFKQMNNLCFGNEQVKWTTGKSLCIKFPGSHAVDYNKTVRH